MKSLMIRILSRACSSMISLQMMFSLSIRIVEMLHLQEHWYLASNVYMCLLNTRRQRFAELISTCHRSTDHIPD